MLAVLVYNMYDLKFDKQLSSQATTVSPTTPFQISDLWQLLTNRSFIMVTMICLTFYSAVFPFQSFSADFFLNKFSLSEIESGKIASYLSLGTLIFTPFFGFVVDRVGKSTTFMIFGSLMLVIIYLVFALTSINPIIPMVFLEITFSLVPASMWPSIPKIVEDRFLGSAYGLTFWIQNIGLLLVPILIGWSISVSNPGVAEQIDAGVEGAKYDYMVPELIFAGFGFLAILFALLLKKINLKNNYGLDKPNKEM